MKKAVIFCTVIMAIVILLSITLTACNDKAGAKNIEDMSVITFKVDGITYHTMSTEGNERLALPKDPTKVNYDFVGWYFDDETFEQEFTEKSYLKKPLNDNITVYARWEENDTGLEFTFDKSTNSYIILGSDRTKDTIELPSTHKDRPVAKIEKSAFSNYKGLKSIIIPETITQIGERAFYGCTNLASITLPSKLSVISNYAFYECSSISDLIIPNSVTEVGYYAFARCFALKNIDFGSGLTKIGYHSFDTCIGLIDVIVPKNVVEIDKYAFENCLNLKSVRLPNSGTIIGAYAFMNCEKLESINIPYGNTQVEKFTFYNCQSLATMDIPYSVNTIGEKAFDGCINLKTIEIPDSVSSIEERAFNGCSALTNISIADTVANMGYCAFGGCSSLTQIVIPKSMTSIGNYLFKGCSALMNITLPDSITRVGEEAFTDTAWYNSQPDGVVSLGKVVYKYKGTAPKGSSMEIANGMTTIADSAFAMQKFASITIPESINNIGYGAFKGCDELMAINVNGGNSKYRSIDNCLIEMPTKTLILGCKSSVIPIDGSVTNIADFAFYGVRDIRGITISNTIRSIGEKAFYGCNNLKDINFIGTIYQWKSIKKRSSWDGGMPTNYIVHCSDGNVNKKGEKV